jgi:hypothetical protein
MIPSDEGPRGTSYNDTTSQGSNGGGSKCPTFKSPLDLRSQLISEGTLKDRDMEIYLRKTISATPVASMARSWVPGKCIPQAPQAPKHIVSTPQIDEQKQYMRDYALIRKNLGLWPSKKELVKWIYQWWKPKGHFNL